MFPKIELGRYYPSHSAIHKLSPLTKLFCLFLLFFSIFIAKGIGIILLVFYIILLCSISKVPYSLYIRTLLIGFYFFVAYTLINILIGVSYETILEMAFRFFGTILISSILLFTTKPMNMNAALEQALSPLKRWNMNPIYITFSITLALHFIPLVMETAIRILKALSSSGCSLFHSTWKQKLLYLRSFFVPLFVLSFRKSDQFAEVLEVRQFSLEDERTYYHSFKWTWLDNIIIISHLLLMILLIVWR